MSLTEIILIILWISTSLIVMIQYVPVCNELSTFEMIITGIIFIIGGPFFAISNALEGILSAILPEGWDDDEPPR